MFLIRLQLQQQSTPDDVEFAAVFSQLKDKIQNTLKILEFFQHKNSDRVFNTGYSLSLSLHLTSTVLFVGYVSYFYSSLILWGSFWYYFTHLSAFQAPPDTTSNKLLRDIYDL